MKRRMTMIQATTIGLAMLGLVSVPVQASRLRVQSMGDVRICTDDVQNDAIVINPARTAYIKQRQAQLWGGPNTQDVRSNTSDKYLSNGQLKGSYTKEDQKSNDLYSDLLGFFPVRKDITLGFHAYSMKGNYSYKYAYGYSGRDYGTVTVSTEAYNYQQESSNESNRVFIDFLGGMKVKQAYVGLLWEQMLPYTYINRYSMIENDSRYYGNSFTSSQQVRVTSTEQRSPYNIKAGFLFLPRTDSSVDIVINPYSYSSSRRITSAVVNEVETWTDNRDTYPKTNFSNNAIDTTVLYRQRINNQLNCGLQLSYIPGHASTDMERSSYTYTSATEDDLSFKLGAGVGYRTPDAFLTEFDLFYTRENDKAHEYSWNGASADESGSADFTRDDIEIRLGIEKWLLKNKLALRAGGVKSLYRALNTNSSTLSTSRDTFKNYTYVNSDYDTLTAGFEWVVNKDISFEYAFISASTASHKLGVTYLF